MPTKVNVKIASNALRERTETLKRYYDDVKKYDVLSKEDEMKYFNMYNYGSASEKNYAYNMIISSNQRFVIGVAKRYATDDNILDLIEEGNVGLIEAFHKYDATLGNKFISYAVHYIRRAINTYLVNHNNVVRRCNNHKIYHLASKAKNLFIQENMRQPTLEELLDLMNERFDANLQNANDLIDLQIMSIDVNFDSDSEIHGEDFTLYNDYTASQNAYESKSENEFKNFLVRKTISCLSEKEQTIIKMSFAIEYDREYDIQEIAEVFGCSFERIRQLKKGALKKMKKYYIQEVNNI